MNLDNLAVAVRSHLADVGMPVSSADVTHRSPDLLLSYPSVGADALGEILAAMASKIVFLSSSFFDAQELDAVSDDLLRSTKEPDGDLYSLSVVWVADGLLHAWFATAERHDDLGEKIELDEHEAQTADETDREVDLQKSRTAHRKLLDLVLSTAQFRQASTNRRTAQADGFSVLHPMGCEASFPRHPDVDTFSRSDGSTGAQGQPQPARARRSPAGLRRGLGRPVPLGGSGTATRVAGHKLHEMQRRRRPPRLARALVPSTSQIRST